MALAAWAGDFWKDKKPEQWSGSEVETFLSKSPWSKTVALEYNQIRSVTTSSSGVVVHGVGAGPENMRGYSGEIVDRQPTAPGAAPAVVRWETAPLVRAACAKAGWTDFNATVAGYAKLYYVISVTMPEKARAPWLRGPVGEETKEQTEERLRETLNRMLKSASLKSRGKTIRPERVEFVSGTRNLVSLYLFPRTPALEGSDDEVDFMTVPAPMVIRAKFKLKEMGAGL
jgi:hypothetical protein